jgi:hypothetical protein
MGQVEAQEPDHVSRVVWPIFARPRRTKPAHEGLRPRIGILIAPLRPTAPLAKTGATFDAVSGGRT